MPPSQGVPRRGRARVPTFCGRQVAATTQTLLQTPSVIHHRIHPALPRRESIPVHSVLPREARVVEISFETEPMPRLCVALRCELAEQTLRLLVVLQLF